MSFSNTVAINQHVRSGRLRALAVAGARRTALMPEVPTMKEAGVEGVEVPLWFGLLAPAATPRGTVRALAAAVAKAANSPDTRKRLLEQGAEPVGSTPEEFDRQLREEVVRWAEVVKISGARGQWTQALKDVYTVLDVGERGSLDRSLADLKPDVLLLDLALHRLGGLEGVQAIRQLSPETKIVLFARSPNAKEGISLLKAGAWGYCEKAIEPLRLRKVVLMLQQGEVWVKRNLIPHLIGELARLTRLRTKDSASHETRLRSLTPREREVVLLIGEGVNNKKIASRLTITEHTVKAHLTTIFRKLGLSGRVQLALLANESGGPISPTAWENRSAGEPQGSTRPKSN